ncbi:MAG: hypothetical protein V3T70_08400 [Phycisphaerae bacterium]
MWDQPTPNDGDTGGWQRIQVPAAYRNDPLLRDGTFYQIPRPLLDRLVAACGRERFNDLDREYAIADALRDDISRVGFRQLRPIIYLHLSTVRQPFVIPDGPEIVMPGWTAMPAQVRLAQEQAEKLTNPFRVAIRGYLGWLMTNPQFLRERDKLFEAADPIDAVDAESGRNDLSAFCGRWRLAQMVTRVLPEPLAPNAAVADPSSLPRHHLEGAVMLYLPDTMPVPPRDTLRNMLEQNRRSLDNAHLTEWSNMVRSDRTNNREIESFGTMFILNHYLRILRDRHPALFRRNQGRIDRAFAQFLGGDLKGVYRRRRQLEKRLAAYSG